jgi:hypothetical protein
VLSAHVLLDSQLARFKRLSARRLLPCQKSLCLAAPAALLPCQRWWLQSRCSSLPPCREHRDSLAHSLRAGGRGLPNGGSVPASSAAGDAGVPSTGELLPVVPGISAAMPGMSTGLSGLSFML